MRRVIKNIGPALAAALLLLALAPDRAFSHAVFLFAWEEDGQVCTSSYYGKKSVVAGGRLTVMDQAETVIAEGVADQNGNWCFPRPESPANLTIILNAGQGHRQTFDLSLEGAVQTPPAEAQNTPPAPTEPRRPTPPTLPDPSPNLRDIIGGLGWIVGIAGIAAFIMSRRKR